MSIQNIMNVCFAICITLLIYQNTQLKDEIVTVKGFSQLDVDKSWDRMDELEEEGRAPSPPPPRTRMVVVRKLWREVVRARQCC